LFKDAVDTLIPAFRIAHADPDFGFRMRLDDLFIEKTCRPVGDFIISIKSTLVDGLAQINALP
jgi:hypothetical protein